MRFPWLPRFNCFIRSTVLILVLVPIIYILRITGFTVVIISAISSVDLVLWLGILTVCLLLPVYLLGFVDQWLWGNPPKNQTKFVPCLSSLGEGLYSWLIVIFTFALIIFVYFALGYNPDTKPIPESHKGPVAIAVWLLFTYWYHLRWVVVRAWQNWKQRSKGDS